jgi:hypothetical protein
VAQERPHRGAPCAYNVYMTQNQLMTDRLTELQDFMFDTMCSGDMALDWFCDRFNVSATDDVVDFVLDAHFGMFADQ